MPEHYRAWLEEARPKRLEREKEEKDKHAQWLRDKENHQSAEEGKRRISESAVFRNASHFAMVTLIRVEAV